MFRPDAIIETVQLSPETGVEHPFVLNMPRLSSPDVLEPRTPSRRPGPIIYSASTNGAGNQKWTVNA
jgi:hypothetical protein